MTRASALHAALADPTREQIVRLLIEGERSVGEIADKLPVSRPAVSKHLRLLESVELVSVRSEGTRNVYSVKPESIAVLRDELDKMWERALARFALVANNKSKPTTKRQK
ncbi:helix-turn-helix transcriptional regulator [Caenimonas koreensis]|uniref:Metalloregulator ArsR/SmtB family transcription factor n=1 Tax=Caenimonas koreensis DSM 17982 TaxID=1121255 RepID=A0A844BAD6_9BURK|nr:metalloregulator ArsR/SmtB family transcription factor [Caenimonas koreensis]MRD48506.1 metalloregulator ArsR/SmtB family transcription factor [Caenimonas koreensis DSM 17982]